MSVLANGSWLARRGGIDLDQVRAAAGAVVEPEIDRPLAELGLLGEVSAGAGGRVRVAVALIVATTPRLTCCTGP